LNELKVVGGNPNGSLLSEMRSIFIGASSALLCVAFINRTGVALLEEELSRIGKSGRILLTTVFGSTTKPALTALHRFGLQIKILNLSAGTYHPKVYISESAKIKAAAVGSANLTSGLIKNVEVMTVFRGEPSWNPLREISYLAEDLWSHKSAIIFRDYLVEAKDETFSDELLKKICAHILIGTEIHTISQGKTNRIVDINPAGVLIETKSGIAKNIGPQLVDAWMIELAWDYIRANGEISNKYLCNELRVKRSAAVCLILSCFPEVEVASTLPVVLKYKTK
jgi:HKD family nuclease